MSILTNKNLKKITNSFDLIWRPKSKVTKENIKRIKEKVKKKDKPAEPGPIPVQPQCSHLPPPIFPHGPAH